ncbi:unnamed protein product [Polarella glacialis]|uniref:Uncharacterized protein n=1 Tax=Polarella glacialis TaxID=89957 RepID=A0A813F4Z7_POLGL|nr:unnamed protein product [Polarella glacialis]
MAAQFAVGASYRPIALQDSPFKPFLWPPLQRCSRKGSDALVSLQGDEGERSTSNCARRWSHSSNGPATFLPRTTLNSMAAFAGIIAFCLRTTSKKRKLKSGGSCMVTACASVDPIFDAVGGAWQSDSAKLLRQWRTERRTRLLGSVDWSRYHLWVYFVDGAEPSYARARLCRFFFEKVCQGRDSSTILYCAAGGLEVTRSQEEELSLVASVPNLQADDLQNLALPPYMFAPTDLNMYDVIVAMDEETCNAVREQLRATSSSVPASDPDQLCILHDFLDAYDVLKASEQEDASMPLQQPKPGLQSGFLSADTLQNLSPGQPLRGEPLAKPVGSPMDGVPVAWETWGEAVWSAAQHGSDTLADASGLEDVQGGLLQPQVDTSCASAGRLLRSVVGLERCLHGSIPVGMRWWNDEE